MPTVELLTVHTHRGAVHRPGARLTVDDFTARWLIARGVATLIAEPATPEPPTPEPEPVAPVSPRRTRRASPDPASTPEPSETHQ